MFKNKLIIATIIIFTICSNTVKAQDNPVSLNIRGGMNISTYGGDLDDTKMVFKQQFGIGLDIAVTKNLYLLTGIDFHMKGSKNELQSGEKIKYNANYLQLPLHVGYKIELSKRLKFLIGVGPYIAYGIGGKIKGEEKVNSFGDGRLKKFDYGLSAVTGLEFNHSVLKVGYDYGLYNISDISNVKIKNRSIFITSGYRF